MDFTTSACEQLEYKELLKKYLKKKKLEKIKEYFIYNQFFHFNDKSYINIIGIIS